MSTKILTATLFALACALFVAGIGLEHYAGQFAAHTAKKCEVTTQVNATPKSPDEDELAKHWKMVPPGPGRDLCLLFKGRPAFWTSAWGPNEYMTIMMCLTIQPMSSGIYSITVSHFQADNGRDEEKE